jgi:hypothetical protein
MMQDEKEQERLFWEEFTALLIQLACLIERDRLKRENTTADLRKAGRKILCDKS